MERGKIGTKGKVKIMMSEKRAGVSRHLKAAFICAAFLLLLGESRIPAVAQSQGNNGGQSQHQGGGQHQGGHGQGQGGDRHIPFHVGQVTKSQDKPHGDHGNHGHN